MKNINYFITAEETYKQDRENIDAMHWNPDIEEFEFVECPVSFLSKGRFAMFQDALRDNKLHGQDNIYNLTDVEGMVLSVFMADLSQYFRDDYYIRFPEIPEVVKEMRIILESAIRKAPKHDGGILYRFLNTNDNITLCTGDILKLDYSLTTTTSNWGQDKDTYIISPLPNAQTQAYVLYKIYNHGDENQVNFLSGVRFVVTRIEYTESGKKHIYLSEM